MFESHRIRTFVQMKEKTKRAKKRGGRERRRRRHGQPLCVCFAYLRQICCLVSDTGGSPLTNWGAPGGSGRGYVTAHTDNFQACTGRSPTSVRRPENESRALFLSSFPSPFLSLSLYPSHSLSLLLLLRARACLLLFLRLALVKLGQLFPVVYGVHGVDFFRRRRLKHRTPALVSRKLPGMVIYFGRRDRTTSDVQCGVLFTGEFTADDRLPRGQREREGRRREREWYTRSEGITYIPNISPCIGASMENATRPAKFGK